MLSKYMIFIMLCAVKVHGNDGVEKSINQLAILQAEDQKQPGNAKILQSLFGLADQVSHADFWSLGGGRGPTTPESLQISILAGIDYSKITPEVFSKLSGWHAQRMRTLIYSDSTEEYRLALTNNDPVVRWMALKLLNKPKIITGLVPELETIITTDDWFQLSLELAQPIPGSPPPPPGSGMIRVVAPLRKMALQLLKSVSVERSYDDEDVERNAMQKLSEIAATMPEEKGIIIGSLSRIVFHSHLGLQLKQALDESHDLDSQFEKLKFFANKTSAKKP